MKDRPRRRRFEDFAAQTRNLVHMEQKTHAIKSSLFIVNGTKVAVVVYLRNSSGTQLKILRICKILKKVYKHLPLSKMLVLLRHGLTKI